MDLGLHFIRPWWLLALPAGALLLLGLARVRRASGRRWEDLIDPELADAVLTPRGGGHGIGWLVLLGLGWLLLVLALSGPAWERAVRPVFRIEQPRVLLLDLSTPMQQRDQGVGRLQRARFELLDLLRGIDEGQTGLIVYGPEPFLIAPLTTDTGTLVEQVPVLAPDLLPVAGEGRIERALRMAGALLRRSGAAAGDLILISAGGPVTDAALATAAELQAAGNRVSVLAVGAAGGALGQLAAAGGGLFIPAALDGSDTMRLLALADGREPVMSGEGLLTAAGWQDRGFWLLLPLLPLAALAFRRGWLGLLPLALLLLPPAPAQAWSWESLWLRPEQRALRDFRAGRTDAAAERFADPRWRAAALYRAGDFVQALAALSGQQGTAAHYNRGNVLARLGRYDDAIAEYDAALLLAPEHADAQHNRALLLALLERDAAAPGAAEPAQTGETPSHDEGGESQEPTGPDVAAVGQAAARASADAAAAASGDGVGTGDDQPGANAPAAAESAQVQPAGEARPSLDAAPGRTEAHGVDAAPRASDGLGARLGVTESGSDGGLSGAATLSSDASEGAGTPLPVAQPGSEGQRRARGPAPVEAGAYLLRQVPDDPSGLLRQRLMLQHLRRHGRLD